MASEQIPPPLFGGKEDYALSPVPGERSKRLWTVANVLLGIPTALVFFATGAQLALVHGVWTVFVGASISALCITVLALLLTSYAAHSGLNSDLMSIPAGFGRRGSGVTSAIYSATFLMLFAIEANIIASAVHEYHSEFPKYAILLFIALLLIVSTWQGVQGLNYLMAVTLPIFLVTMIALLIKTSSKDVSSDLMDRPLQWSGVLVVAGALMAFIVNATVAADVGRFLGGRRSRISVPILAIGLQVLSLYVAVLVGAWIAAHGDETDPGVVLVSSLGLLGIVGVVASQFRINLINMYAGSLSLSNFGRRTLGWQPGRNFWAVIVALAGTGLAMSGIYANLIDVLTFEAVFTCAWVGVLTGTILQRKLLKASPTPLDTQPDFDPAGLVSLVFALLISLPLAFNSSSEVATSTAPFVSLAVAGVSSAVLSARFSRGVGGEGIDRT